MSSQPPASAPTSGNSKSAAKKRAKKAKAAANKQQESAQAGPASADKLGRSSTPSLERYLYPNPPGSYPGDDSFQDSSVYYDDEEDLLPPTSSTAQGSGGGRGAPEESFSFASYAFGDRTFTPPTNGSPFGGLSQAINITHEDLLETANELWKRMGETQYGEDDPYWSSLPPHVRQFIREAIPFNAPSNTSNDPQATQKDLYAMAQRIVHAASQGMGLQGVGSNLLSQVNGRAHLQASIAEDLGFHRHPDSAGRIDDEFDDDEDFEDEPEPGHVQPNGDAPKKKNKKKKKKAASQAVVDPPPATLPPPAVKQPPRQPVPPQPSAPQPALNPPPPPATPVPSQPPPSSRAAGKQPMAHTPAPPANPPTRSVRAAGKAPVSATSQHSHHNHSHAPPASKTNSSKGKAAANPQPAKIWTTASAEEREAITFFWLGLKESERRELLQIEKDAVLKRMKEQQRHSCGCAVCGRKKGNIEKELEQLYNQYYDDLERYTEHTHAAAVDHDCPPPPGAGPFPGSVELDSTGQLLKLDHLAPHSTNHQSLDESDEYEDEDDYDDDEELDDDELASDDADVDYPPRKPASKALTPKPEGGDDFFGFGSSLATVKGIITVADDMLKNDGAKFLEMMEQLAEKRIAREDMNVRDLQDETDEEEDEEDDDGEEDDEDDDDDDVSESHRMVDGRRMFAIFAARMFEQRVLQAYRESLAKEREEQLLRELEAEEDTKRQKEEKKAKEAQRKKDKKKLQKQRQEEERAERAAAQAEEQRLAKLKAAEEAKERHRRQEEERQRREAVKRAALEEASRKEAERKKRQEEERAREEEAAKKKREREEKIKKEREARDREAKDKERRDKEERDRLVKIKAEKDRVAKEAKDKAEKERLAKVEEERVERQRRDEAARREREAAEQKKLLAAQQAAREKAAADKAAAADKKKTMASAPVRPPPGAARKTSATAPPPSRNGPTPQSSTPALLPSPPTPNVRPGSSSRGPKTPQQPYGYPQPVPTMSYGARPAQPPGFAPGSYGRPQAFSSHSPVFPPTNGQMQLPGSIGGSLSGSPSARYGAQDTFDSFESRAPLGVGYPKNGGGPSRVASAEDPFRSGPAPVAPIGQRVPSQPASAYGGEHDDSTFIIGGPDPIAPPGPIGSRAPGFDSPSTAPGAPVSGSSSASASARQVSPSQPEQVFGSAALGDDDEIVQPAARRLGSGALSATGSSNWKLPPAPGAGRWSAAPPSIWGMEQSPWSAPPGAQRSSGFPPAPLSAPLMPPGGLPGPVPGQNDQLAPGPPGIDPRRGGFNAPYYGNQHNLFGPH